MATRKWGSEKLVNTTTAGRQILPDVAVLTNGTFIVVWEHDLTEVAGDAVIRGQLYDDVGNKIGTELAISAPTGNIGDQTEPTVAALANGGFYVSWDDEDSSTDHDIVGAIYDANGTFVRSQDSDGSGNDSADAAVARLGAGSISVWTNRSGTSHDINYRIFDAAGNPGPISVANTNLANNQLNPDVAVSPDQSKVAIIWTDISDFTTRGRLFNPVGGELAPEFVISSGTLGFHNQEVIWLNNWHFVVVWTQDDEIRARIFDGQSSTVVPLTGNIPVNSTIGGTQQSPAVTALPNGGFVVAWESFSDGGPDSDFAVRLQGFDGGGNKIGGEIVVNTTTTDTQGAPSISALPDGRVVVTWLDLSETGDTSSDIRMQIVDPRDGIVTGTPAADTLYGHDLVNDEITGFAGADLLLGLGGGDGLYGGDGNDVLNGGNGDDVAYGGNGNDSFVAASGAGNDLYDGEAGVDTVSFASATLPVIVNLATGQATGAQIGTDQIANVENVVGGGASDTITGNGSANTLNGGAGNDILIGLGGDDWFIVDAAGDQTVEAAGQGTDRVFASVSYTLGAGQSIESFSTTNNAGTASINLTGNELAQSILGNAGINILNGAGGIDTLTGLGGSDQFIVDNAGDRAIEAAGQGTDRVFASVTYTLGAGQSIELFSTTNNAGTASINLVGNELVQSILGNAGNNTLNGGAGNDTLTGGLGSDFFLFNTALNAATNVDRVMDFNVAADTIRLENAIFVGLAANTTLAAGAFRIGAAAVDIDDRIIYNNVTGALIFDSNGNAAGGATQFATLTAGLALTSADFFVV